MSQRTSFWRDRAMNRKAAAKPRFALERLEDRTLLSVHLAASFGGLNQPDSFGSVPPDTIAAVGPSHVVELVNTTIAVFDKATGAKLFSQSLNDFFGPLNPGSDVFDPVVAYDEIAGRFLAGVVDMDEAAETSFFDFAVSDGASPLDDTGSPAFSEMHQIDLKDSFNDGPLSWGDYPRIGWNADAYVITFNMFAFSGGQDFDHVEVVAIDRTTALDGSNETFTTFRSDRDSTHFTLATATMHGSVSGDPMWFVEEGDQPEGASVRVVKMTDVLSDTPGFTDSTIGVGRYTAPPNATQRGSGRLDTQDSRILNAAWRDNRLVASQTVGAVGLARARWYEFDTSGDTPTLTQTGTLNQGRRVHTYYPSIEIAANGDLGMTFMQSSSRQYMSMYVTGHKPTDPPGAMQKPLLVKAGRARYRAFDKSPYRAGDYSGITVDPVTGTSFWAANEYATASPPENWGTFIASFSISPPPSKSRSSPAAAPAATLDVVSVDHLLSSRALRERERILFSWRRPLLAADLDRSAWLRRGTR